MANYLTNDGCHKISVVLSPSLERYDCWRSSELGFMDLIVWGSNWVIAHLRNCYGTCKSLHAGSLLMILKQLWLQCLPLSTRQILATQSDVPLSSLAETADKIHECFADRFIASTSQQLIQRDENPVIALLDRMQVQIDQLVAT
ncbi:hypothetical protein X801_05165, partial [Opisthorchis viverrini]